jgi:hypothetical protein
MTVRLRRHRAHSRPCDWRCNERRRHDIKSRRQHRKFKLFNDFNCRCLHSGGDGVGIVTADEAIVEVVVEEVFLGGLPDGLQGSQIGRAQDSPSRRR